MTGLPNSAVASLGSRVVAGMQRRDVWCNFGVRQAA